MMLEGSPVPCTEIGLPKMDGVLDGSRETGCKDRFFKDAEIAKSFRGARIVKRDCHIGPCLGNNGNVFNLRPIPVPEPRDVRDDLGRPSTDPNTGRFIDVY